MNAALRILLVEDDEDDVVLVTDQLGDQSAFDVRTASCVQDAIDRLREVDVDCVLLDLHLPDATGFEGLERLLNCQSDAAVVVLTGDLDDARGAAAVARGAQDYLVKGRGGVDDLTRAIGYAIERRNSARLQQEYAVAQATAAENARLQRGLLPAPIMRSNAISVATTYQPGLSRQLLGGDFYDVVQTDDGMVHALIGDVCGHGPDEAALGVRLRIAWRTLVLSGAVGPSLFATLDRVLEAERDNDSVFITAAQVSLAADLRTATVQIAGHPSPLLTSTGGTESLEHCGRGPAFGFGTRNGWPQTTIDLPAEWTMWLYTDGLIEARTGSGSFDRLGTDGLLAIIADPAPAAGTVDPSVLQRIVSDVTRRNAAALVDDVAVLALNRHAAPPARAGHASSTTNGVADVS